MFHKHTLMLVCINTYIYVIYMYTGHRANLLSSLPFWTSRHRPPALFPCQRWHKLYATPSYPIHNGTSVLWRLGSSALKFTQLFFPRMVTRLAKLSYKSTFHDQLQFNISFLSIVFRFICYQLKMLDINCS